MEKGDGVIVEVKIGKGGITTVPKQVLDYLKLGKGDQVSFEVIDKETIVMAKYVED